MKIRKEEIKNADIQCENCDKDIDGYYYFCEGANDCFYACSEECAKQIEEDNEKLTPEEEELLYKLAKAFLENPDKTIGEVAHKIVSPEKIKELYEKYKHLRKSNHEND